MKKNLIKITIVFIIFIISFFFLLKFVFFGTSNKRTKASGESIQLILNPESINSKLNDSFAVSFKVKPSTSLSLRGYKIAFNFDKSKINLTKIEYKIGQPAADLADDDNALTKVNQSGAVLLIGEITTQTGYILAGQNETEILKLTFKTINESGTTFKINNQDAVFYTFGNDMALTETPISSEIKFDINGGGPLVSISPIVTISSSPSISSLPVSGNVKLNLKLRFQGINKKPNNNLNSINIKLRLKQEEGSGNYESIGTFTSDDGGLWLGTVGFNIQNISGKWNVYIKGPNHIQKKICDAEPKENKQGDYRCNKGNISISLGDNNFNFSGITLLVGDLDQNGITDSVDYSLVRNNLGKTDIEVLKKADLNRDGKVDTQDFSLILYALSIRPDEM